MTRAILALLLLSSCTAQADAPSIQLSEVHAIESFVEANCHKDEPECALQCGNKFPTEDLTPYHEACLDAARDKFNVAGGEA